MAATNKDEPVPDNSGLRSSISARIRLPQPRLLESDETITNFDGAVEMNKAVTNEGEKYYHSQQVGSRTSLS